ncbi:toll/interleukin-1 receptor domain-containing protein [Coleofasciculus sp.]|uniref:toll/interleukin-1 receptor domain-containing protein n=1 Tax=Coleofasciculus sp. TaxID=3100458 RepID=UPI0039F9D934
MQAFLCYSRRDKKIAERLCEELELFCDVWVDWDDIAGGSPWEEAIWKGIIQSDYFVILVSEASTASPWCQKEVNIAQRLGKPVFPVVLDDRNIPPNLAKLQWIVFDSSMDDVVRDLLAAFGHRHPDLIRSFLWIVAIAQFLLLLVKN